MTAAAPSVVWAPQPGPQTALLQCPFEDCFYGGARGGGKTDGCLGEFAQHAGAVGHAARGIFFRRTLPELEDVERRSHELYLPIGAEYNAQKRTWNFPPDGNGLRPQLRLRYLDRDEDAARYQGHQYTREYFDEAGNWPRPAPIDLLWGSLRSPHGVPVRRIVTGNPGGVGHVWLKRRYIDPARGGWKPYSYQPQPDDRPDVKLHAVFIPAKLEDNPLLMQMDPGYEARLAAAGSAALYRAWRYGDWDVIAGAVFEEWRPDLHIVPTFKVPPHWLLAAGMDWGYRAPGCLLLFASGPDGDCVAVREDYFNASANKEHAQQVGYRHGLLMRDLGMPVSYIAADEQMWYQTGVSAPTLAEEYQNGLWSAFGGNREMAPRLVEATHGRGSRRAKLQLAHRYLGWRADATGKIQPWNRPLLRFTTDCVRTIETVPALPYDPTDPEDVDTKAEDHAYDALSYYLMSRPPLPEAPAKPVIRDQHPGLLKSGSRRKPWQKDEDDALLPYQQLGWTMPRQLEQAE